MLDGASHVTDADAFAGVATTLRGADGAAFIAADDDADDAVDVPAALVAVTLNV
jgi:hypothetical protein